MIRLELSYQIQIIIPITIKPDFRDIVCYKETI